MPATNSALDFSSFSDACRMNMPGHKLVETAKENVRKSLDYQWTPEEEKVISYFFTNPNGRVFLARRLTSTLWGNFFTMCANEKNDRGMRGVFVDRFLPALLAKQLPECDADYGGDPLALLIAHRILSIKEFASLPGGAEMLDRFLAAMDHVSFISKLTTDTRGVASLPNDNKDMGMFLIGFEGISLLTAQSIRHLRGGFGSRESENQHTGLFPEGDGREHYPIERELEVLGVESAVVRELIDWLFDRYHFWRGKDFTGPFPKFLHKEYKTIVDAKQLEVGVRAETSDALAAFLPACTYTGFALSIRESELAEPLRLLLLENTSEAIAITDVLEREARTLGYDLTEHLDLSPWAHFDGHYLKAEGFSDNFDFAHKTDEATRLMNYLAEATNTSQWHKQLAVLNNDRRRDDNALPDWLRTTVIGCPRLITFQTWCRLQRMRFIIARRSLLSPRFPFFKYGQPAPDDLEKDFAEAHKRSQEIFGHFDCLDSASKSEVKILPTLRQFVMPIGSQVATQFWHHIKGWETLIAEETGHHVPRGTHRFFLGCYNAITHLHPTIKPLMRVDLTPDYTFSHCPFPIVASDNKAEKK